MSDEEEIIIGDEDEELDDFPYMIEGEQELRATPYRIMLVFTGADTGDDALEDVIQFLIAEAEARGLFHLFSMATEMDLDEVDAKSELYEVITGREAS